MSFESLSQISKDERGAHASQTIIGVVVDNNDPEQRQRVRVNVPGLLDAEDLSRLPWMLPKVNSPYGMADTFCVVNVPRIGARVTVYLQDGDVSYGVYDGSVATKGLTLPPELAENYPNRRGGLSPAGLLFYEDMSTGEAFVRFKSGTAIRILPSGEVQMTVFGDLTQVVKGNYTLSVDGDYTEIINGSRASSVTGDSGALVGGDNTLTVSGDSVDMTAGSRTVTCSAENRTGPVNSADDITAGGISLINHLTTGVDSGPDKSGPPTPP